MHYKISWNKVVSFNTAPKQAKRSQQKSEEKTVELTASESRKADNTMDGQIYVLAVYICTQL